MYRLYSFFFFYYQRFQVMAFLVGDFNELGRSACASEIIGFPAIGLPSSSCMVCNVNCTKCKKFNLVLEL
uniref:Putative secreted protein n=1 Tax=Ixodes ricinus TaxID=34613 RepID=A0A6B0U1F8_IXORI